MNVVAVLILLCSLTLLGCAHQPIEFSSDLSKAASYNVQLGLAYLQQGNRPRAKQKLLTALAQAPKSAEVNTAMAYYFEKTQELSQAKSFYKKALVFSKNSGAQLNNYGVFLCKQQDFKQAEYYFVKASKDINYINTAQAYENAGLCTLAIPDTKKAIFYFTEALKRDPSLKTARSELHSLEKLAGNTKSRSFSTGKISRISIK